MIYANKLINVKSLGTAGAASSGGANPVSNNNTNNIPMQTNGFNQPASPNNINQGGGNSNGNFSSGGGAPTLNNNQARIGLTDAMRFHLYWFPHVPSS